MQGKATNSFYQPGPNIGNHMDRLARCRSARALIACVALAKPKSSRLLTLAFALLPTCRAGGFAYLFIRFSSCALSQREAELSPPEHLTILRWGPLEDGDFSYLTALRAFESLTIFTGGCCLTFPAHRSTITFLVIARAQESWLVHRTAASPCYRQKQCE